MNNINTIFYSNKCEMSRNLLMVLKNENLIENSNESLNFNENWIHLNNNNKHLLINNYKHIRNYIQKIKLIYKIKTILLYRKEYFPK